MKTAFFTEGNWTGKVPRDHPNMRTDLAWECVLNADHYPLNNPPTGKNYDLGIIIVSKKYPELVFDNIEKIKSVCKQVAVMQEGPNWYWQEWDLETQIKYFSLLREVDIVFCHSKFDKLYYKGLLKREEVYILPTLIIDDAVDTKALCLPENRKGVMVGGNFVSWYSGFDSYSIALEFEDAIYAPSMGRKRDDEDSIGGITHLPYMYWREWMTALSNKKYAVHLIRNKLAGTFSLNCAYLGIPCIGYKGLDTQELCHPKTSVNLCDLEHARIIARELKTNKLFYDHCAALAKSNFEQFYSEKAFMRKFNGYFE